MFSPTGYMACYTLSPSGLAYTLPIARFDEHGIGQVADRNGILVDWTDRNMCAEISASPSHVTPSGEQA